MSQPGYPNVHVRLRLAQRELSAAPRDNELEIWLRGARFHVRDVKGRVLQDIVGDVTDPRQLGALSRTIEDMMDREAEASSPAAAGPTELFGDLDSDEGWVLPADGERWAGRASSLAPVAEQILARDKASGLQQVATPTRLGRAAIEYRGVVTVPADGTHFKNEVTRVIAGPFLLLEDTHNAASPTMSYVREIVALDEGTVTEADVTPPAP